jgi:phospholipase/lecithinase/hemolysin
MHTSKLLICLVFVVCVSNNGMAQMYSELVVFGDSLSDAGNVLIRTQAMPEKYHADPPAELGYFQGRATNGPNWVDHLADLMSIPRPTASESGGLNYAFAGARTGSGTNERFPSPTYPPNPSLTVDRVGTQIQSYLTSHSAFTDNQLVTLWAGANDIVDLAAGTTTIETIVNNIEGHVRQLAANGATTIVIPNQPDASLAPFFKLPTAPNPRVVLGAIMAINTQLEQRIETLRNDPALAGKRLVSVDMFSISQRLTTEPATFGLTNTTDAALSFPAGTVVPNPNEYVFWDLIHPTTAAQRVFAVGACDAFNCPEPSSIGMLTAFIFGWISRTRIRRRDDIRRLPGL